MPTPLTVEQKAVNAARSALQKIVELHLQAKESGDLKYCSLCFRNWPCETYKFAEGALSQDEGAAASVDMVHGEIP